MALDSSNSSYTPVLDYRCRCWRLYDGHNCVNCSYNNVSWVLPERVSDQKRFAEEMIENKIKVSEILSSKWNTEWFLKITLTDAWSSHDVYIDYEISLEPGSSQIVDDEDIIKSIEYSFRDGGSKYVKNEILKSWLNIEDEIRKAYYWEN